MERSTRCPASTRKHGGGTRGEFIRRIVRHLETKCPEAVLGYHTCGQSTAEWFYVGVWEGGMPGFEPVARPGLPRMAQGKTRHR